MKIEIMSSLLAVLTLLATAVCWRGVWGLFDLYLLPNHPLVSYLLSLGMGVSVFVVIDRLQSRKPQ